MSDKGLAMLRELWRALGCAPNPDDFKPAVQAAMWQQAIELVREQTDRSSRIYRENDELLAAMDRDYRQVKADAWDEGFRDGQIDMIRHDVNTPEDPCITNPYRTKESI